MIHVYTETMGYIVLRLAYFLLEHRLDQLVNSAIYNQASTFGLG